MLAVCALFAKWINLPALYIVWGRCFFATIALLIFCFLRKTSLQISSYLVKRLVITGALLACHWWSFFHSIQLTNVAVGLLTFACFPLFVPILERIIDGKPLQMTLLIQGLLCLLGIYLVLPDELSVGFRQQWQVGILLGLLSAATFALVTFYNRRFVQKQSPLLINLYQQATAMVLLSPWLLAYDVHISGEDILLLLLLGTVFTALTHTLITYCLRFIPAFSASLAFTLEPVYGIVAAHWLLQEPLTLTTMLGGGLIVAVCAYSASKQYQSHAAN